MKTLLLLILPVVVLAQGPHRVALNQPARYAVLLNGSTQYLSIAHASAGDFNFERTDAFSIVVAFKRNRTSAITETLLGKTDWTTNARRGWSFGFKAPDSLRLFLFNTSSPDIAVSVSMSTRVLDTTSWHLSVCTYNGSSNADGVKIYFDGLQQGTKITHNNLSATTVSTVPFAIGAEQNAQFYLFGSIGPTQIVNKVLSADEVSMIYVMWSQSRRLPVGYTSATVLGNWDWNGGLIDKSPRGNHLTNNGGVQPIRY